LIKLKLSRIIITDKFRTRKETENKTETQKRKKYLLLLTLKS